MKLKNKKTGEIMEFDAILPVKDVSDDKVAHLVYNSLAELNEEWEDVGDIDVTNTEIDALLNWIEEARESMVMSIKVENAVEKLKAFSRLEDKGFKFKTWGWDNDYEYTVWFKLNDDGEDSASDLNLLFNGEE